MDEETESPLEDSYAAQDDPDDEALVARSSIAGSVVASTGG